MSRNKVTSITIMNTRDAATVANKFAPSDSLETLPFWEELKPAEQAALAEEAKALNAARIIHGTSGMAIGEHLSHIKKVLEKHTGAFDRYLASAYIPRRSGYRYIEVYEEAASMFSPAIMMAAMVRNMTLPGRYAEAITKLPPPHRIDVDGANAYLDKLKDKRVEIINARREGKAPAAEEDDSVEAIRRDPAFLKMTTYRTARNALRQMSARQKRRFLDSIVGMLLTELGISGRQTFEPEAIPDTFRMGRGRPKGSGEKIAASA